MMATGALIALAVCAAYWLLFAVAGRLAVARNWFPGTAAPKPPTPKEGGRG